MSYNIMDSMTNARSIHFTTTRRLEYVRMRIRANISGNYCNGRMERYGYLLRGEQREIAISMKRLGRQLAKVMYKDERDIVDALSEMRDTVWWRSSIWDAIEMNHSFDDIRQCAYCGRIEHYDDMNRSHFHDELFCDSCDDSHYVYSDIMESYIRRGQASCYYHTARAFRNGDHDYIIGHSSEAENAYERNGEYFSSEAYSDLGFHDDDYDGDDDDNGGVIGDYHSSRRVVGHIPSSFDERTPMLRLGLELEVEVEHGYRHDEAKTFLKLLNKSNSDLLGGHQYCATEGDGSLDNGFEIVTGYTGLDVHSMVLASLVGAKFNGTVKSHDTNTCGLHVHIDKADMSPFHASKLVAFIHDPLNRNLIATIARRYRTADGERGYAKFDHGKDKVKTDAKRSFGVYKEYKRADYATEDARRYALRNLNSDRYEAINFQNERTIEFRLFRGTLKYETIMACLEFTYASWLFTRDMGMSDLTDESFCNYIARPEHRPDTKFLRRYLKLRKHQPMLDVDPQDDKYEDSKSVEKESAEPSRATAEEAARTIAARAQARADAERERLELIEQRRQQEIARAKRRAEMEAQEAAYLERVRQEREASMAYRESQRRAAASAIASMSSLVIPRYDFDAAGTRVGQRVMAVTPGSIITPETLVEWTEVPATTSTSTRAWPFAT